MRYRKNLIYDLTPSTKNISHNLDMNSSASRLNLRILVMIVMKQGTAKYRELI